MCSRAWRPRCALADGSEAAGSDACRLDAGTAEADPGRSIDGVLAVAAAALLPLVFSPAVSHTFWAPKASVCLLLVGPGLVALTRLVLAGDTPARVAALFLAASTVSTLASGRIALALTGPPNWGTGLVFVAALTGAWALGRSAGEERRRQVVLALLLGALVNALVAWLQSRGLVPPSLESPDRSAGLMGNPVHLGALCAGGIALTGDLVRHSRRWPAWLAGLLLLGGAAQLSGSRSAVGLCVLATATVAARAGWRRGAAAAGVVLAAFLVAGVWAGAGAVTGSGRSVGPASGSQVAERADLWRLSAGAILDRPVLGWGPGRFEAATSPRYTAKVTEGGVRVYEDAHNWVVEYATTTGIVGLALLLAWLATAAPTASGPLATFALLGGLFLLVEPQSVGFTPLVLLAFGAARRVPPGSPAATNRGWRVASAVALAGGAATGAVLLTGEVFLHGASLDNDIATHGRAAAVLPPWPEVSIAGARIEAFAGLHSAPARRRALALAGQAARRDPSDAAAWSFLGQLELVWGTDGQATVALDHALDRNPWLAEALQRRALLAGRTGDGEAHHDACRRLRVLDKVPEVCGGPATVKP